MANNRTHTVDSPAGTIAVTEPENTNEERLQEQIDAGEIKPVSETADEKPGAATNGDQSPPAPRVKTASELLADRDAELQQRLAAIQQEIEANAAKQDHVAAIDLLVGFINDNVALGLIDTTHFVDGPLNLHWHSETEQVCVAQRVPTGHTTSQPPTDTPESNGNRAAGTYFTHLRKTGSPTWQSAPMNGTGSANDAKAVQEMTGCDIRGKRKSEQQKALARAGWESKLNTDA